MENNLDNTKNKTSDIFKGVFINIAIALGAFISYWLIALISNMNLGRNGAALSVLLIVVVLIYVEYYYIRKYLKEKKYVAIGMIIAIVFPLLVIGTCSPIFMDL